MEGRVLLAIFLCFLVIYLWQALFVKSVPKPDARAATPPNATAGAKIVTAADAVSAAASAPAPVVSPAAAALVSDARERDVRVETADVIAVFTNRGARLKSWRLKRFADQVKQPLELIATDLAATQRLPFSLRVADAGQTGTLNAALYTVRETTTGSAQSPADITFEYRDTAGLHAVKQFHLEPKSYLLTFRDTVTSADRTLSPQIEWGPGLSDSEVNTKFGVLPRALLSANGKEQRIVAATIAKQSTYENNFAYAGIDDHYFMSVAFEPGHVTVAYEPLSIPPPEGSKAPPRTLMAYTVDPGVAGRPLTFYIGPKDFNELAGIDRDFVRAVDFGKFSFIVVPLLRSLNWIFGYVHNYGWSIVLLTVIINVITFPLRHWSVVSMRKMQAIQPEVKAIQDRYAKLKATDPAKQKMNAELTALYKQRNVNPASGCVPMLLPIPLLFAFYALLTTAIELRGAPFMFWIHDLSAPDPYYVFPVLMGISQLWQQWMMPSTGVDPSQRTMAMIMPIVYTFFFINYPSGMAVYYLVTNMCFIGQQYFTNYLIGPSQIRARGLQAPAERRTKHVGSGKTDSAAREE